MAHLFQDVGSHRVYEHDGCTVYDYSVVGELMFFTIGTGQQRLLALFKPAQGVREGNEGCLESYDTYGNYI